MKNLHVAAIAIALVSTGACTARTNQPVAYNYQAEHAAKQPVRVANAQARQTQRALLARHGIETKTGGFHIVRPEIDLPGASSPNRFSSPYGVWDYWSTASKYPGDHLDWLGLTTSRVQVTTERVFPNCAAVLSKNNVAGSWQVDATFDQRALENLSYIHGPITHTQSYRDWLGVLHDAGGPSTEMVVALVRDGISWKPFSVTDLIALGGPQTVMVADCLTETEASGLIAGYGN